MLSLILNKLVSENNDIERPFVKFYLRKRNRLKLGIHTKKCAKFNSPTCFCGLFDRTHIAQIV